MNKYVTEAFSISQKLSDIGTPVDDELLAVILLARLSPEYKPMVIALDSLQILITTELVKNKLLQADMKSQLKDKTSEVAFVSTYQQRKFNKKEPYFQKREIICHGCGEKGHIKSLK